MKRLITILIIITTAISLNGQDLQCFPSLTRISIDTTYQVFFNYNSKSTFLINKPCYQLPKNDPLFCNQDSIYIPWIIIGKYHNQALNDSLTIIYSQGPSDDPGFVMETSEQKTIRHFSCIEFSIDDNGTIFTSGHVNNLFNRKRKFEINQDTIIEFKQPFYYVGLKGKTLKGITLYSGKSGDEVIADVPEECEIEILLGEPNVKDFEIDYFFLVRTNDGLVGWLRLKAEDISGSILTELYYNGD